MPWALPRDSLAGSRQSRQARRLRLYFWKSAAQGQHYASGVEDLTLYEIRAGVVGSPP
jgi:hypothetical protein